ncbi:hypothetical protein GQ43DRAFT_454460 [Delitschia confertaspora ATCC 74209]|uniref:Uncharacterized protein n=1 Tax=Delitschia confertaspora ATCC 74209 TaxID=1513339 RepID=A0A9P4MUT6_9PLEO|nr:hypothetical protein GQ43DRAFT_454460 [Delitschia confertaspora ATCC 74209]
MAEPLSPLSSHQFNSISNEVDDATFNDPPSSPFVSYIEQDQENLPPVDAIHTPRKPSFDLDDNVPQSAFKIPSPSKTLKGWASPAKSAPTKQLLPEPENAGSDRELEERGSPKRISPLKQIMSEGPGSALREPFRARSPSKDSLPRAFTEATTLPLPESRATTPEFDQITATRLDFEQPEPTMRDNEGLTVAMKFMETQSKMRNDMHESRMEYNLGYHDTNFDDTDFNADGPDATSLDFDDTSFSAFSEMPNLDMTKFAVMTASPAKNGLFDQATPRARGNTTPGTVRRSERTPSPTPRRTYKENDTTNLLLDFTAQIEAFSGASHRTSTRGRQSPVKSNTESNLLSYIQNQRSPAKSGFVPSTPAERRQVFNLLDFELPPPPTPRSVPTVTIRELESLKSGFQSQISSLTASLSGKEAEVESLAKAVSNAERRVGEAHEAVREERSAREHAEAQMEDWKKKGEEVQKLLQDVQANLNRNDEEREMLIQKLAAAEQRAEEAENRASDAEARAIEAENKVVDTTTFVDVGTEGSGKRFSEEEVNQVVAEKVNEVARDLHAAYKAKHEKKIAALKGNYQRKSDEKIKEYKDQILKFEKQIEELQNQKDDTFTKLPALEAAYENQKTSTQDKKRLEEQQTEIENLKAKLAGLTSQLTSLRSSHNELLRELELERVEKGELVAAAEQMLALSMERMEVQQEELQLRRSQIGVPAPPSGIPSAGSGGSGIARPSGLRGPGFGSSQSGLSRSGSNGAGKSRLMSNIERMGARSAASNHGE